MNKKEKISPCLWFNGNAEEAAKMYCTCFPNSKITARSPFVIELNVSGQSFTLLDGGPKYQPNHTISFYYICESETELNVIWECFTKEGKIRTPLDKYPWGEKYGWVSDKFGVSWQVALGKVKEVGQKITPCLTFTGKQYGKAEEAMSYYQRVFRDAKTDGVVYKEKDKKIVEHAQFTLLDQKFMVMDQIEKNSVQFSEGVSLTLSCETQDEIDYYWNQFTEDGEESMCGWLKDKHGVSWQIIPSVLSSIMRDPIKAGKAAEAFMAMRKLDIEQIVQATLK